MPHHRTIALSNGGFAGPTADKLWPYLLEQTGKQDPMCCYVGTASGDDSRMIVLWYESLMKHGTRATHLPLIRSLGPERTRDLLLSADLIYVGGGNTAAMLSIWRQHGVDSLLAEAADGGAITAGGSAGAICWFDSYVTDSFGDVDPLDDGLGWVPGAACTHWDSEPLRRTRVPEHLRNGLADIHVVEDGTGLILEDGAVVGGITSVEGKRAFVMRHRSGEIVEDDIELTVL